MMGSEYSRLIAVPRGTLLHEYSWFLLHTGELQPIIRTQITFTDSFQLALSLLIEVTFVRRG